MKIVELIAENFKKLRVVEIAPDGKPIVQITGRNGQGKSSVLDSLWFGLKGQKALPTRKADAVRRGTEKMKVTVKVGEAGKDVTFTITRTLGTEGNPPTLSIVPAVHKQANKTPQDYLDDLFGALTFDPLAFAHMSTAEQVAELKKTAKVDLDFEQLAEEDAKDYREREGINREVKYLKERLDRMQVLEGLPKDKLDTAAIVTRLNNAAEANKRAQAVFAAKQELGAKAAQLVIDCARKVELIDLKEREIEALEEALQKAKEQKHELDLERAELELKRIDAKEAYENAPAGELVDVGALTAELQAAERTNQAIDARAEYDATKAERDTKQQKADQLTRRMEARAEKKRIALSKAKIPVEGLTFDEIEVKYNGIPIENLGEGEQIRISTLIGMAANPKLRILCIRHGEALDEEGLKQLAAMAKEHDFQIWMARVDSSGKCGIVIEDGSVAARNED